MGFFPSPLEVTAGLFSHSVNLALQLMAPICASANLIWQASRFPLFASPFMHQVYCLNLCYLLKAHMFLCLLIYRSSLMRGLEYRGRFITQPKALPARGSQGVEVAGIAIPFSFSFIGVFLLPLPLSGVCVSLTMPSSALV